jgi:hypothetical protein
MEMKASALWARRHPVWAATGHVGLALGIDCRASGFAPLPQP